MTRVYAKHPPYPDGHLARVAAEMDLAGAPTLPAVWFRGKLIALAGSHRLAEAHHRGIAPKLVILRNGPGDDGLDEFFARALETMPWYDFDHVLALDTSGRLLRSFRNRRLMAPARARGAPPEIVT